MAGRARNARLRVLPVYNGNPGQHYLVLDRVSWDAEVVDQALKSVEGRLSEVGGTLLGFREEIDIPEADNFE